MSAPLGSDAAHSTPADRLIITVRFLDGRWHGAGAWPPAPLRLFQALVAGAAEGRSLPNAARQVLSALEALPPPVILAPRARVASGYTAFVPNNSLDALEGDLARTAEIRVGKTIRAHLFDADEPLVYVWPVDPSLLPHAEALAFVVERLHQLGRGVDAAFATAEIVSAEIAGARLLSHGGVWHRPGVGEASIDMACPAPGTLDSLIGRHADRATRFSLEGKGRSTTIVVSTPRRAVERRVPYGAAGTRLLFDLVDAGVAGERRAPWPQESVVDRVTWIRDSALARLITTNTDRRTKAIDPRLEATARKLFGLEREATEADKAQRLRIIPIPSIGMPYTDPRIRRVLVVLPPDMPLRGDVEWAFRGLSLPDEDGQPIVDLVEAEDRSMLAHYAIGTDSVIAATTRPWEHADPSAPRRGATRVIETVATDWITITPIAVPEAAGRRRIDPARRRAEAKGGRERAEEERVAIAAIRRAIEHVGLPARPIAIEVRRDPYFLKGAKAERFEAKPRFPKERLWHARIRFDTPVAGPVVLGDGRYLGLGLMAEDKAPAPAIHAFALDRRVAADEAPLLATALRRAMMARVGALLGKPADDGLPKFFSGHAKDGEAAREGTHDHLYCAVVPGNPSFAVVIAPHLVGVRQGSTVKDGKRVENVYPRGAVAPRERKPLAKLADALLGFDTLTLGDERLRLAQAEAPASLIDPARRWVSATPYVPTRHAKKREDLAAHIAADLIRDALARGLPRPEVQITALLPAGRAIARLTFATAIDGPILLGRDAHKGGGVFVRET